MDQNQQQQQRESSEEAPVVVVNDGAPPQGHARTYSNQGKTFSHSPYQSGSRSGSGTPVPPQTGVTHQVLDFDNGTVHQGEHTRTRSASLGPGDGGSGQGGSGQSSQQRTQRPGHGRTSSNRSQVSVVSFEDNENSVERQRVSPYQEAVVVPEQQQQGYYEQQGYEQQGQYNQEYQQQAQNQQGGHNQQQAHHDQQQQHQPSYQHHRSGSGNQQYNPQQYQYQQQQQQLSYRHERSSSTGFEAPFPGNQQGGHSPHQQFASAGRRSPQHHSSPQDNAHVRYSSGELPGYSDASVERASFSQQTNPHRRVNSGSGMNTFNYSNGSSPVPPPAGHHVPQQQVYRSPSQEHLYQQQQNGGHQRNVSWGGQSGGSNKSAQHRRNHSRQFSTDSAGGGGGGKFQNVQVPKMFHTRLQQHGLQFIPYPEPNPGIYLAQCGHPGLGGLPGTETNFGLFFGQVKFEATMELMLWLIHTVVEGRVLPVHIHPRGTGCFMAYFDTQDDAFAVQRFHDSILFDETGVWLARTGDEFVFLQNYCSQIGSTLKGVRLPRGAMVIRK